MERLVPATLGGLVSFALFFVVNLMNPRWMAFGDVRLSLVFGFGLAWVSPTTSSRRSSTPICWRCSGWLLMVARRADRRSALPFGLFMALGPRWSWSLARAPSGQPAAQIRSDQRTFTF